MPDRPDIDRHLADAQRDCELSRAERRRIEHRAERAFRVLVMLGLYGMSAAIVVAVVVSLWLWGAR